jgi:hypothetical protein
VSGWGPLFPFTSMKKFNLTHAEAVSMFLTGGASPFRVQGFVWGCVHTCAQYSFPLS